MQEDLNCHGEARQSDNIDPPVGDSQDAYPTIWRKHLHEDHTGDEKEHREFDGESDEDEIAGVPCHSPQSRTV